MAAIHYTVRRRSLSKIARQYKPETVSLDQMLVTDVPRPARGGVRRQQHGKIACAAANPQHSVRRRAIGYGQPGLAKVVKVRGFRISAATATASQQRRPPALSGLAREQASGGGIGTAVEDKGAAAPAGRSAACPARSGAGTAQAQAGW